MEEEYFEKYRKEEKITYPLKKGTMNFGLTASFLYEIPTKTILIILLKTNKKSTKINLLNELFYRYKKNIL